MSFRTTTSPVDRQGNVFSYPPLGGYFFFPREKNRFFRFFPSQGKKGNPRFFLKGNRGKCPFFSLTGKGKILVIFPYFLPTSPSSIQKPPCSFNRFLTVLSVNAPCTRPERSL